MSIPISESRSSIQLCITISLYLSLATHTQDIGYGSADNQKSKSSAYEKAKKEAVTDAMKRALRMFGNRLGNCAYDKGFLRDVKMAPDKHQQATVLAANYPKVRADSGAVNGKISYNSSSNNDNNKNTNDNTGNGNIPHFHPNTHTSHPRSHSAVPAVHSTYDESLFDNSMMISEEDLIIVQSEDNFGHLSEAAVMELEESFQDPGIYPLLPNKRK